MRMAGEPNPGDRRALEGQDRGVEEPLSGLGEER